MDFKTFLKASVTFITSCSLCKICDDQVLLKVMGTHNDFRSSAETQVKSPQHLKLDIRLLRHRDRQLFYNNYVQKKKRPT